MTIRTTPPISLSDVLAELRLVNANRTYPISLGDADVRALAGIPSGAISLSDLYGKSSYVPMTVYATDGYDYRDSSFGSGVASASGVVSTDGGKGTKFYNWTVLSNPGGATVTGHSTSTLTATKSFVEQAGGGVTVTAQCAITDETGAVVTSPVVSIVLEWGGTL